MAGGTITIFSATWGLQFTGPTKNGKAFSLAASATYLSSLTSISLGGYMRENGHVLIDDLEISR